MIYRPQYAFSTPKGFRDEQFHYSFDGTNVAALGASIPTLQSVNNILLQLQNDAAFVLRGLKIQLGTAASNLQIQIKDPFGNYLSASTIALSTYLTGAGAAVIGRNVVPFESEIVCPIGGFFEVFLYNPTGGGVLPPAISLFGVKRYKECAA